RGGPVVTQGQSGQGGRDEDEAGGGTGRHHAGGPSLTAGRRGQPRDGGGRKRAAATAPDGTADGFGLDVRAPAAVRARDGDSHGRTLIEPAPVARPGITHHHRRKPGHAQGAAAPEVTPSCHLTPNQQRFFEAGAVSFAAVRLAPPHWSPPG